MRSFAGRFVLAFPSPFQHESQYPDGYADGDRAVREIEDWEIEAAVVHVDEINHASVADPVNEIPERAGEDQRKRGSFQTLRYSQSINQIPKIGRQQHAHRGKPVIQILENAERSAGVTRKSERQERQYVNDSFSELVEHQLVDRDVLCQLVRRDDQYRKDIPVIRVGSS